MINYTKEIEEKLNKLKSYIKDKGSLAIGFSGGVDSTFLLMVAHEVLGDKAVAITAVDASLPKRELDEATRFCSEHKIRHISCKVDPMVEEEYRHNGRRRCYYCKKIIFSKIKDIAEGEGISFVAEGSNMDDMGDYRPGFEAIKELEIVSPLQIAGLYKEEIRTISKTLNLPTWNKPSYACLASRFAYGEDITEEKLHMIEQAEDILIGLGFYNERVRLHGNIARIEVSASDIERLASSDIRNFVHDRFKELGFDFVTIDMKGYRLGSMNTV